MRGFARLTESAFRRLEVALSSLGIYSTKYYPPGRGTLGARGFARFWGSRGGTEKGLLSPSHSCKNVKTLILFAENRIFAGGLSVKVESVLLRGFGVGPGGRLSPSHSRQNVKTLMLF